MADERRLPAVPHRALLTASLVEGVALLVAGVVNAIAYVGDVFTYAG